MGRVDEVNLAHSLISVRFKVGLTDNIKNPKSTIDSESWPVRVYNHIQASVFVRLIGPL